VILLLVFMTLLLLRYNCIPLYQSLNFVWSLSNYPGSGTMLFSMTACMFSFVAGASATDISVSVCSYSFEAFSMIYRDPSHSNNVFISFVLLELVLVLFCSLYYTCFVQQVTLPSFIHGFCPLHLSCKVSLLMLYQILQPLLGAQVALRQRLESKKGMI